MKTTDHDRTRAVPQGRWVALLNALDETGRLALATAVDAALSGRIRDLALTGHLRSIYLDTSWRQRSRVARAWLLWAVLLDCTMILLDWIYLPVLLYPAFVMRIVFLPIVYLWLARVWSRPRADWIEGSTLPVAIAALGIVGGVLGLAGGDQTLYRYLTAAVFAASTAIVIFPVTMSWTVVGVVAGAACYAAFSLFDPVSLPKDALAFSVFYAFVLTALIPARRTLTILQQHAFVLNLRSALQEQTLASANARLAVLASTDALTGLPNRRAFQDESARLWADPSEPAHSLGIVLFDIDHFKRLNDSAGHAAGDECLAAIARTIREVLPENGMCARYGGEEFICILRDATPRSTLGLAEAFRSAVESLALANPGIGRGVTISVGLALGATDRRPESLAGLIGMADEALYRAKATGRNRVAAAWDTPREAAPVERLDHDPLCA